MLGQQSAVSQSHPPRAACDQRDLAAHALRMLVFVGHDSTSSVLIRTSVAAERRAGR
jgi:hypothetical protein